MTTAATQPASGNRDVTGRWFMLAMLFTIYVFNIVDRHIVNILLEPIRIDLGLSDSQAGFIAGFAFAIFYTLMAIPIAILADRRNRTLLISLCSALWSLATAATGIASAYATMAVTRMSVGIGEAGLTPTANSLIGDLFKPSERGLAIGIYQSAVPLGSMLAGLVGALMTPALGWRMTFVALGVFGLVLTLLFRLLFREPVRGRFDESERDAPDSSHSLAATIRCLIRQRSCRLFFPAFALLGFVGSAVNTWTPAYFIRSHDMSLAQAAALIGVAGGISGVLGMVLGGVLSDRLSSKDPRAYMLIPCVAQCVALPFFVAAFLSNHSTAAIALLILPLMVFTAIVVPALALLHRLVSSAMRAVAVALFFLVIHLVGMGGGPVLVGFVSDYLTPRFAGDALRYAIILVLPLNLVASWLLYRASHWVSSDLAEPRS